MNIVKVLGQQVRERRGSAEDEDNHKTKTNRDPSYLEMNECIETKPKGCRTGTKGVTELKLKRIPYYKPIDGCRAERSRKGSEKAQQKRITPKREQKRVKGEPG